MFNKCLTMAARSVSRQVNNALRRLMNDLKELTKEPVIGASIAPISDENLFTLHANIVIPEGPYQGLMMHVIINIPESYPASSPAGSMAVNFPFTDAEHMHIHGTALCNDYLSNYEEFFKRIDGGEIKAGSGWTPAMTLKGLLMILRTFFAETDRPDPSPSFIKTITAKIAAYKCPECGHTTANPLPDVTMMEPVKDTIEGSIFDLADSLDSSLTITTCSSSSSSSSTSVDEDKARAEAKARAIMHLVCSISKENYIDDPKIILGYPVSLKLDHRNRLDTKLFAEMTSYEQFILGVQNIGVEKLDDWQRIKLRSPTGHLYNNWFGIYIDEDHFQRNLEHIQNTLSVLSNGSIMGTRENEFKAYMVLRVIPALMNQMVVAIMCGESYESENMIFAYCHYLRLFLRFLAAYPVLDRHIDDEIAEFISSAENRNKSKVPDLGEFWVKLFLSKRYQYDDPKVKTPLIEEAFARQVMWIHKADPTLYTLGPNDYKRRLEETFKHTLVSNRIFVFNIVMGRTFNFPGVEDKLDSNFGLPPVKIVEELQATIKQIKDIKSYPELMKALRYSDVIKSDNDMFSLLVRSVNMSEKQRYTSLYAPQISSARGSSYRGSGSGSMSTRGSTSSRGSASSRGSRGSTRYTTHRVPY